MATIVLQAAGGLIGGLFGPVAGAVATAAGALAGYAIDRALIDGTRRIEGPRLGEARPFTAEDGAPLPRVYGTMRVGGTMIWATRFEERKSTRRQGAKAFGGPKVTEYSYFANVAFAFCEGEIAGVRRVWADGRELDLEGVEMRVHRGGADQMPDPLIEAKQGTGKAPAYRGVAYAVFERLPLDDFGNRIPQLQFEVMRPVGRLERAVRAVVLIPGATEYGLSPARVTRRLRPGETVVENRHVMWAGTDIEASLNELQALCPALEHVAVVATWFGDDLRAGECRIRPGVTTTDGSGLSQAWSVGGLRRGDVPAVSQESGGAAYGGTPSDASLIAAIAAIKARGLKVTLYPFVMMDIAADNTLPNPYGGSSQPAYPWRGRITCDPAPGQPASADKTADARAQVEAFRGTAVPADFTASVGGVAYAGAADDWGYRRLVLHYARLAEAAGGVDAFLIGSELRGLTTLRDGAGAFPFVEALCELAEDVRGMLGGDTGLSYGADWSEYFGHHPDDGSGDHLFHLDALWAYEAIDAVGIDNYLPLSDWRDEDYRGGNPDGSAAPFDTTALRAAIAGGERFDWFYADDAARAARERTPISDGAYAKPWTFRPKDLVGWWSNPHHDRHAGVEETEPTAWVPQSKPIWFTELGCPAVDKGPNQPNVFVDPKSSESFLPHHSNGSRDDTVQRAFLDAHLGWWDPAAEEFEGAANPVSAVYDGRMVDPERIYLWAWDARPYPAFPARLDRWSDGSNWASGHWLTGRLGGAAVGDLVNAILSDHGLPRAETRLAGGTLDGYVVEDPGTARRALEPLVDLFGLSVQERGDGLRFVQRGASAAAPATIDAAVLGPDGAYEQMRLADHELPTEVQVTHRDAMRDYQGASARAVRADAGDVRLQSIGVAAAMDGDQAGMLAEAWLHRRWEARESVRFAVAGPRADIEPGRLVRVPAIDADAEYEVTETADGLVRRVTATRLLRGQPPARPARAHAATADRPAVAGPPAAIFLDLPTASASVPLNDGLRLAAWSKPWRGQLAFATPGEDGYEQRGRADAPATIGRLAAALAPGFEGRIDRAGRIEVDIHDGELASIGRPQLLNGGNRAAIRSAGGAWEIVQFQTAEEVEPGVWRLSNLLRGQLGTGDAMLAGAGEGADFVLLDAAVVAAGLAAGEIGLALNWRVGPAGADFTPEFFETQTIVGGVRAGLPLAPCHLRMRREGDDVRFTWVRRGRLDPDDLAPVDVPMGEAAERYEIAIGADGGPVLRGATVTEPSFLYAAAAMADDFGDPPPKLAVTVRQVGDAGAGVTAARTFSLS